MLQIYYLNSVDSTQKYLQKQLRLKRLQPPVCVVANIQTDGIGSRNNNWISHEGNLFFSFALARDTLPNDLKLASASIYFSYLLQEVLVSYGSKVWIKWPNDFYLDDKKIGGTITHIVGENIICGIGLNLKKSPKNHSVVDIIIEKELVLKNYFKKVEKKILWKQVFSKYKLEFHRNKDFFTHTTNGLKVSLGETVLEDDGSLSIDGERIYSLR